jgi:hypothetical protein
MPQIQQPYYNLHQITKGLYTDGNEFVLSDGTDYIGLYHSTPNGQFFTGARPERTTVLLKIKRFTQTNESLLYNKLTSTDTPSYINPVLLSPLPTLEDYKKGSIQRYFLQKRNNPQSTIVEVDGRQYNSVNTTNKPGINGVIWNRILVNWVISKIPKNDAKIINGLSITKTEIQFPHLKDYLKNQLEFYQ